MTIDDVLEFLKSVPPFHDFDDDALRIIAGSVSMEFYPKGSTILHQDGPASEYLRIVRKGTVKVSLRPSKEEEVVIDYRSEGDSFGFLSLLSGDKSRANVVATEDTTCYLIRKETILKLLETHPAFAEYFLISFFNKYLDKTTKEMQKKSLLYGGGNKLLFSTPVGEIITKEVCSASQDIPIKEAAEIMSQDRISSLVLLDADGVPSGIVTDRDLRDKVVSKGRNVMDPVSSIMSVFLIKADARDYCFEALLKMIRYNVHHLLIIENGSLKGVITNHDLMMLQGTSPVSIAREMESQQTIEGLVPVAKKISKIVELLIKEGASASNITSVITEINDRLVRKVIEITEKKLGNPPVNYCWIVFGSEGRKEQVFKTDQDNGLIYEDPETPEKAEEARTYFSGFTLLLRDSFMKCGFPLCPLDYMASNPQWCQPLRVWKKYFSDWINEPSPEGIFKSLVFFDFRPIHGEFSLAEDLRNAITSQLDGRMLFFGSMANTIIHNLPPLGFFKTFIVEKSGEHKDEFDLKLKGITPLVDAVRLFALEKGITETSTIDRIHALKDKHTIVREYADELEYAFEFIMLQHICQQFEEIREGKGPDHFVNPYKLNNHEKKTMKEAFYLISKMQGILVEKYKTMIR
jgi:CBS domain-containing protein